MQADFSMKKQDRATDVSAFIMAFIGFDPCPRFQKGLFVFQVIGFLRLEPADHDGICSLCNHYKK
jgi:hypothetical protein